MQFFCYLWYKVKFVYKNWYVLARKYFEFEYLAEDGLQNDFPRKKFVKKNNFWSVSWGLVGSLNITFIRNYCLVF